MKHKVRLHASTLLHRLDLLIVCFINQMSVGYSKNWDQKGWPGSECTTAVCVSLSLKASLQETSNAKMTMPNSQRYHFQSEVKINVFFGKIGKIPAVMLQGSGEIRILIFSTFNSRSWTPWSFVNSRSWTPWSFVNSRSWTPWGFVNFMKHNIKTHLKH